jgi:hypothetical protein
LAAADDEVDLKHMDIAEVIWLLLSAVAKFADLVDEKFSDLVDKKFPDLIDESLKDPARITKSSRRDPHGWRQLTRG